MIFNGYKWKYIYVKGKKIYVTDEVYRAYKKEINHETYLKILDIKHKVFHFGDFNTSIVDIADSFSFDNSRVKNHYVYGNPYGSLGLGGCYNSKETVYKSNNRQKVKSNNINRYDEIKKFNSKFNKSEYKEKVIEKENIKYYELYKLKDEAKTGNCYVVHENNGEIKVYENNIKFGITEENTLNKSSISNIETILSKKFSGKTKIVKTEMIYQDGTFYKRNFVENVIDGEFKTGFDIYKKQ